MCGLEYAQDARKLVAQLAQNWRTMSAMTLRPDLLTNMSTHKCAARIPRWARAAGLALARVDLLLRLRMRSTSCLPASDLDVCRAPSKSLQARVHETCQCEQPALTEEQHVAKTMHHVRGVLRTKQIVVATGKLRGGMLRRCDQATASKSPQASFHNICK